MGLRVGGWGTVPVRTVYAGGSCCIGMHFCLLSCYYFSLSFLIPLVVPFHGVRWATHAEKRLAVQGLLALDGRGPCAQTMEDALVGGRPHRLALSALIEQWGCTAWSLSCMFGLA